LCDLETRRSGPIARSAGVLGCLQGIPAHQQLPEGDASVERDEQQRCDFDPKSPFFAPVSFFVISALLAYLGPRNSRIWRDGSQGRLLIDDGLAAFFSDPAFRKWSVGT